MRLKREHATDTFINGNGYYAIRQESWPDDDSIIELTPAQMRLLIKDMREHINSSHEWFSPAEDDGIVVLPQSFVED